MKIYRVHVSTAVRKWVLWAYGPKGRGRWCGEGKFHIIPDKDYWRRQTDTPRPRDDEHHWFYVLWGKARRIFIFSMCSIVLRKWKIIKKKKNLKALKKDERIHAELLVQGQSKDRVIFNPMNISIVNYHSFVRNPIRTGFSFFV